MAAFAGGPIRLRARMQHHRTSPFLSLIAEINSSTASAPQSPKPRGCFGLFPPFDRIHNGMTPEQVEKLLGSPDVNSFTPIRTPGKKPLDNADADRTSPVLVEVSAQEWKREKPGIRICYE